MKKISISIAIVLTMVSCLNADNIENQEYCEHLHRGDPERELLLIDSYNIEYQQNVQKCEDMNSDDLQIIENESQIYAYLKKYRMRNIIAGKDRIKKVCSALGYEILVSNALRNKIDNYNSLIKSVKTLNKDYTNAMTSCLNLIRTESASIQKQ